MAERAALLQKNRVPVLAPPDAPNLNIEYPEAFSDLFEPDPVLRYRFYVYYGGRDSAKSWTVAEAIIATMMCEPVRVLCTREIQQTIAESVHQLLADTIDRMGVGHLFDVQKNTILCQSSGASVIYHGLRDLTADNIKSFEAIDIAWIEEGHRVTKRSLNILINTLRAKGSEIWVTFNPELDSDEVYARFVVEGDPQAKVVKVTFRDNPWRSEVLEAERQRMKRLDPLEYDNIYEGNPRTAIPGALYTKEIAALIQQGRYRSVPYDPRLLVHSIWDVGWNDQTSVTFAQRLISEVRVIDYDEESFLRPDQWAGRIADRDYTYGGHWLPHDAAHERMEAGGKSLKTQFEALFKELKVRGAVRIIPRVEDEEIRIRATRQMFPRVYMDRDKCSRLHECLRRVRRAIPQSTGEEGHVIKDEFKHGADSFGELARIVDKIGNERDRPMPKAENYEPMDAGMGR